MEKNNDILSIEKAKEIILKLIKNEKIKRSVLIKNGIDSLALTDEELKDKRPNAALNLCKSRFGNAIDILLKSNIILEGQDLLYIDKTKEETEETIEQIKKDDLIQNVILEKLKAQQSTKDELFDLIKTKFNLGSIKVKNSTLLNDTGRILSKLVKEKLIYRKNNKYIFNTGITEEKEEKKEIKIKEKKTLFDQYKEKIYSVSPEFFVNYSIMLFTKYLEKLKYKIEKSEIIDGTEDWGIDGIISGEDLLGYKDLILLQVKHKKKLSKYVPISEVREFCGVLSADEKATKGFFVSNAPYYSETKKFINKYKHKYLMLLDIEDLFKFAKETLYGIQEKDNKFSIDNSLFSL